MYILCRLAQIIFCCPETIQQNTLGRGEAKQYLQFVFVYVCLSEVLKKNYAGPEQGQQMVLNKGSL